MLLTKVNNLASALASLDCAISSIRFDCIVPESVDFTIGNIYSIGNNLEGKKWPNSPSLEKYTDCLTVLEVARTSK